MYSPHVNVSWQERHWNQATFLIGDGMKYSRKGIYNSQNHITLQKVKKYKHFVSPTSYLALLRWPKSANTTNNSWNTTQYFWNTSQFCETRHKAIETQHKVVKTQHKITETQYKIIETQHKVVETKHKIAETQHKITETTQNFGGPLG